MGAPPRASCIQINDKRLSPHSYPSRPFALDGDVPRTRNRSLAPPPRPDCGAEIEHRPSVVGVARGGPAGA